MDDATGGEAPKRTEDAPVTTPLTPEEAKAFDAHVAEQSRRINQRVLVACLFLTVVLAPYDFFIWDSLEKTGQILAVERLCLLGMISVYLLTLRVGSTRLSQPTRTSLLVLAVSACIGVAGGLLGRAHDYWYLSLYMAPVMSTGIYLPQARRGALIVAIFLVTHAAFFASFRGNLPGDYIFHTIGLWLVAMGGAFMGGDELYRLTLRSFRLQYQLDTHRRQLASDVEVATAELRRLNRHLEHVTEEERCRIAREIHDDLGQDMTGIRLRLAAILGDAGGQEREQLSCVSESLDMMHENVRRILMSLRPRILEDLGLPGAIRWLVASVREHASFEIEVQMSLAGRLHERVELAAFRVVQEALSNARRHSEARLVRVEVGLRGGGLWLCVEDDGEGYEPAEVKGQHGVLGMSERVRAVGGRFSVVRGAAGGTRVEANLPLDAPELAVA